MTRLIDVGEIRKIISGSAIERLPVWLVEVQLISSIAMKNLIFQAKKRLPHDDWRKITRSIESEIYKSRHLGRIPECAATNPLSFTLSLERSEIRQVMSKFTGLEKKLIVFSILTNENIELASLITHGSLNKIKTFDRRIKKALSIAKKQPRHIGSDLVFWVYDEQKKPKALSDIGSKFRRATKMQWEVFSDLFIESIETKKAHGRKENAKH